MFVIRIFISISVFNCLIYFITVFVAVFFDRRTGKYVLEREITAMNMHEPSGERVRLNADSEEK